MESTCGKVNRSMIRPHVHSDEDMWFVTLSIVYPSLLTVKFGFVLSVFARASRESSMQL